MMFQIEINSTSLVAIIKIGGRLDTRNSSLLRNEFDRLLQHNEYFVIDCRSENETKCGKFGSAFWIDPKKIVDDENVRSTVLESLEALRGQVMFHYCY